MKITSYDTETGENPEGFLLMAVKQGNESFVTKKLPVGPLEDGLGPQGIQGEPGEKGDTGDTGPAGTPATNTNGQIIGAGTNYNLSMSYAKVNFGTTDLDFTLAAGTYLILVQLSVFGAAAGAPDYINFKLRNVTDNADVVGTEMFVDLPASGGVTTLTATFQTIVTIAGSKAFEVWGQNQTSVRGGVASAYSKISYVKLA